MGVLVSGQASVDAGIARALTELVIPLRTALSTPETLRTLLARYGWNADLLDPAGVDRVRAAFGLTGAFTELAGLAAQLEAADPADTSGLVALAARAVAVFGRFADGIRALESLSAQDLPFPFNQPGFLAELALEVLDDALLTWLETNRPTTTAVLTLLGLATVEPAAPGHVNRSAYLARRLRWDRLAAVADPVALVRGRFRWGDAAGFDHIAALSVLARAAWYADVPALIREPDPALLDRHYRPDSPARASLRELRIPLLSAGSPGDDDYAEAGLSILPVPTGGGIGTVPGGLLASAYLEGTLTPADDGDPVSVAITGRLAGDASFAVRFDAAGVAVTAAPGAAAIEAAVAVSGTPEKPWLLAGTRDGTRIELGQLRAAVEVHGTVDDPELVVSIATGPHPAPPSLAFVVQFGEDDGFLARLFGTRPHRVELGGELRWSSVHGLTLSGAPGLETELPVRAEAAGVSVDSVSVRVRRRDGGLRIGLGLNGSANLGPFSVSVSEVGLALDAGPAARPGQRVVGNLALRFGVQPPAGFGLAIDSPAVSGGGFLRFDPDAGRYVGAFELTLADTVSVKAIALVTTRRPDGSPGFALLIMITADGFTPIPLGLGFTLTGIGGLLALNRTVSADTIRDGLRSGVLDSVLSVKDPVRNASQILAALDRVFPQAPDRLVVGPLAQIEWGSPTILTLRAALLLELPQPVRVVLLAALSVLLPRPDDAVVELHVDSIGVLDFGKGELALDASLHHSRILTYTLTGDMALRLGWGRTPSFVLSLGGFHPRFPAPAGIRPLNRLALTLTAGDNPRVRFEAYLALTSNTLQFGARASVYAESHGFGIDGGGSFDALLQWSPFALAVSVAVWVRVFTPAGTLLGVSVSLEVTGPRPWHLTGQASIEVLWWTIKVPVDVQIGSAPASPEPVEVVDVAALLWQQVVDQANWQATLPADRSPGVTLAGGTDGGAANGTVLAHPLATVSLRQRMVPLETTVARVGARVAASGPRSYHLTATTPGGIGTTPVQDLFAPAQFADFTEDAQLMAPSFVPLTAGLSLQPQAATTAGPSLSCDFTVETLDVVSFTDPAQRGPARSVRPATATGATAPIAARMGVSLR
jgi:Family of unknown function (DUF6603)